MQISECRQHLYIHKQGSNKKKVINTIIASMPFDSVLVPHNVKAFFSI